MSDHYTSRIEDWKKACNIAARALEFGKDLIVKGYKVRDVCKEVDDKIKELGGNCAFPAQVSFNQTAAHACPVDDTVFNDEVVKIDVGAEVNGAIGDNASTIDLSENNSKLVTASRDALEAAINTIKPGVMYKDVGKEINRVMNAYGFNPITNLSGHGLDYYEIHCKPTIPNHDNGDENVIEEGMIFAIEPFATNGNGRVKESNEGTVFSFLEKKPVRNTFEREILSVVEKYKLPFALRWLTERFPEWKVKMALRNFKRLGIIRDYPPLVEIGGGLVSQAEHTVLVTENGCEVLTTL